MKNLCLSQQIHVPVQVAESGVPPVYWCTAHYVEMLLRAKVPLVHSAFRMSGFTPSQVRSVEKETNTSLQANWFKHVSRAKL